jgi:hypothetical protein
MNVMPSTEALLRAKVENPNDSYEYGRCIERPHDGQEVIERRLASCSHPCEHKKDRCEQRYEERKPNPWSLSTFEATLDLHAMARDAPQRRR